MSKAILLGPKDYLRMPWKNGQGMTTEIARFPADGFGKFQWRVSIADIVQSGTFSLFTGYDRLIACVEGEGMRLTVDDREPQDVLRWDQPFFFSGDAAVVCDLIGGPTRDFNLIVSRERAAGSMVRLRALEAYSTGGEGSVVLVHVLRGSAQVSQGGTDVTLHEDCTLRVEDNPVTVAVEPASEAMVAVITPHAPNGA